ncbi:hypothetical protein ACQPZP_22455 [Spirillospora sp. CA-142024]|uniref:hypothetical protein n=1 Tax=Spirillospora sp. CA-142024 TaxID=3240036 RepID=UPI003D8BF1CD
MSDTSGSQSESGAWSDVEAVQKESAQRLEHNLNNGVSGQQALENSRPGVDGTFDPNKTQG